MVLSPRGYPGVFLHDASGHGQAFLNRALYLPKDWAGDRDRRREAGIPEQVCFATKGALARAMRARAMRARACASGVPARWVTADEAYGNDGALRRWLQDEGQAYGVAVNRAYMLWSGERCLRERVETAVAALPEREWERVSVGEGSKGPRLYDWAMLRFPVASPPGWRHGMRGRRALRDPTEIAYYRVFAPAGTPVARLARVAGTRWTRWTIETGFERATGEGGLDAYEVRRWAAWYRYITLALLADAYLAVTRMRAPPPFPPRGRRTRPDPAHGAGGAATAPAGDARSGEPRTRLVLVMVATAAPRTGATQPRCPLAASSS